MSKTENKQADFWQKLKNSRLKEWLMIAVAGILLCVLAFSVFRNDGEDAVSPSVTAGTEQEKKLTEILQAIDGVGKVDVMIGQTEEGVVSVVVVCDGGKDLKVIMDVREATASAVGTHESNVKVYLRE